MHVKKINVNGYVCMYVYADGGVIYIYLFVHACTYVYIDAGALYVE